MNYPIIPQYATSANVRFCWRTYRFENAAKRALQGYRWRKANAPLMRDRNSIRHAFEYHDDWTNAVEQKTPLDYLMEKEEGIGQ